MQFNTADGRLRATLRQHVFVRLTVTATLMAAAIGTCELLEIDIPLQPIMIVALLLTLISGGVYFRLRSQAPVTGGELFSHIVMDAAALSVLLYFTGGAGNPFAYCYLLLVLYAASVLPPRYGWALAALCVLCLSVLQVHFVPLPLRDAAAAHAALDEWARRVMYILIAGLVVWFALRITELRRDHRQHVEAGAEEEARERYLVGLATLAAGTAHEMGTPLSTMSVVVGDLRRSPHPPADWKESIDMLWQQIQLCKHSLSNLSKASDLEQLGKARVAPAREFVESLAERFRVLRPAARLSLHCDLPAQGAEIRADSTLEQALLTLVNNAAEASPEALELRAVAEDGVLRIRILDRGPGIAPRLRERLGRGPVGSRRGGHGLGLLIANSAINRLGGSVRLCDREGGGTCARVELPLQQPSEAASRGPQGVTLAAG